MTATDLVLWFRELSSGPKCNRVLFCLPHAGGGSLSFREWERAVPPAVGVVPVRLPGREQRFAEPPGVDPAAIATAVAARADRPYAVFGHSMGARVAFEVTRELRRLGAPPPLRLYVAAALPPGTVSRIASLADLEDEPLAQALVELIDAPVELRDNLEFRELMLPVLRSDLRWLNQHSLQPGAPLETPIVALAGAADTECGRLTMLDWGRHTSAFFGLHTLPGGHFFPQTHAREVATLVSADLIAAEPR